MICAKAFICRGCEKQKSIEESSSGPKRRELGYNYFCKSCHSKMNTEWAKKHQEDRRDYHAQYRAKNPERIKILQLKARLKRFGLTVEKYMVMLESQEMACAICKGTFGHLLCVDHDHRTGKIRGLLCHGCNLIVGNSKENPLTLERAAQYIKERIS